jgi:hypothetical protein
MEFIASKLTEELKEQQSAPGFTTVAMLQGVRELLLLPGYEEHCVFLGRFFGFFA